MKVTAVLLTALIILNISMPVAAALYKPASDKPTITLITNTPPSPSLTSAPMETSERTAITNNGFSGNASISVTCNVVQRPHHLNR
jgi:hypothetical protein